MDARQLIGHVAEAALEPVEPDGADILGHAGGRATSAR
jgi:hypothetical protein